MKSGIGETYSLALNYAGEYYIIFITPMGIQCMPIGTNREKYIMDMEKILMNPINENPLVFMKKMEQKYKGQTK